MCTKTFDSKNLALEVERSSACLQVSKHDWLLAHDIKSCVIRVATIGLQSKQIFGLDDNSR